MTRTLLESQSELPCSVPLFRHVPNRVRHAWQDWDPALVRCADNLPQYLILGDLDASTFELSASGWSARWQGTEADTHFDVDYKVDAGRWEIRQTWCGQDGGFSIFPARIPLDKVIAQALYAEFPGNWNSTAKSDLEAAYQITVVEPSENGHTFCGIPDGAFRTIAFPIAVRNLRPVQQWLEAIVEQSPPAYPITVEAKLVFQALNYLEGKAPGWTTQDAVTFRQSVLETGLVPHGFPVREVGRDGSAAWTLRSDVYFLFIRVPFAGLTDLLSRLATENGPIRKASDPALRFELQPVVLPAAFEMQAESLALWDRGRTTRSFLQFEPVGVDKSAQALEQAADTYRDAAALTKAETISREVVTEIEQIFQGVMKGGAA